MRRLTDARLRVLFVIPTLTGGGAERVILTLLRHLDRSRFQLALAVVDMRNAVFREDVPEDVELIDLRSLRVRFALPKLVRLIWQRRPDVVLSTLGHLNLSLAVLRPLLPNSTRYLARETIVVSEGLQCYARPKWWAWAYRRYYRRFDRVICQSYDMRDDLVAHFACPAETAVVINNPVDVERIRQLAAEPVETGFVRGIGNEAEKEIINLVAAGRLVPQKGFDMLIEAMALCGDRRLHLTLLGEGPLLEELETLAKSEGMSGRIRFSGFRANPYPFFRQADVFVLSSRFEGFPNVVLEALACGTPVIATPAPGGVRELLSGNKDCVIAGGMTSTKLAEAIHTWIAGKRLRIASDVVSPYGHETIVGQFESVFDAPARRGMMPTPEDANG